MKKKTAKISELIKRLEELKNDKDCGDVNVYVVHAQDDVVVGESVVFNGLSDSVAVMKIVQGDETGVIIFQSDEVLKP